MAYYLKRKKQRQRDKKSNDAEQPEDQLKGDSEKVVNKRRRGKAVEDDNVNSKKRAAASTLVSSKYTDQQRERALQALEESTDLQSVYAALKIVKEIVPLVQDNNENEHDRSLLLVEQASLAVPFLMYKLAVERFTRPLSFGGLAFSIAKAKKIAGMLFETVGLACCSAEVTENDLQKAGLAVADARKVLPHLKDVGVEARVKVDDVRQFVLEDV
jgi:hypothetical protein